MKKIALVIVAIFFLMSSVVYGAYTGQDIYNSMEKTFLWINENTSPLGGGDSAESDYYVIAMSRANRTFDYNKYKKITRSKVPNTTGDAHRIIISNASCDGTFNESFVADYTYKNNLYDTSDLSGAILALRAGEYEVRSKEITIDEMVARLLANQSQNGSFGDDVVVTCKSILALSFFQGNVYQVKGEYKTESYYYDVNNSILRAVNYLQGVKNEDYGYGDIKTTAYVIMALDSAGVDCDNDPGFAGDGKSVFGWLMEKQNGDGSFGTDTDDTAMAVCALVSHIRAMQGKDDFFDVKGYDRIDSPDIYTEEINLSGTGLISGENAKPIEVTFKTEEKSTEAPTEEPLEEIINNEIRDVEKDIKKTDENVVKPLIAFVVLIIVTGIAVICFILWRAGVKPNNIKSFIRKKSRKKE